jgi:hypothetical protein
MRQAGIYIAFGVGARPAVAENAMPNLPPLWRRRRAVDDSSAAANVFARLAVNGGTDPINVYAFTLSTKSI